MLDLRNLKEFPANLELQVAAADLNADFDSLKVQGTAQISLSIMRSDRIYYCQGVIACEGILSCSRCLENYPVKLRGDIDFSIQEADGGSVNPDEIPENEIVVAPGTQEIDIMLPIREAILLEVPLKPLCVESCKGICPLCGGNKNEKDCDCKDESTDTRWDDLRALKSKTESEE